MFKFLTKPTKNNHQYPLMRQPDRLPRCYEMTDDERQNKIDQLVTRNYQKISSQNSYNHIEEHNHYYGA